MKKHFICLANSFKYKGRCLAGIEVEFNNAKFSPLKNEDGTPKWIRPVSREEHGELSTQETQKIYMLDIVEIEVTENCPKFAQSENVYYTSLIKGGKKYERNEKGLNDLCNLTNSDLLFNRRRSIPTDVFQQSGYSLIFIKASNCTFYNDEKARLRVKFSYNDTDYDLPVTDPAFINFMEMIGLVNLNTTKNYYFTISLGEEYEGSHYKLVAGVIFLPKEA